MLVAECYGAVCARIDAVNLFTRTVLFFFNLAWNSRQRLPTLLAIVFMATDYRFQMQINIHLE